MLSIRLIVRIILALFPMFSLLSLVYVLAAGNWIMDTQAYMYAGTFTAIHLGTIWCLLKNARYWPAAFAGWMAFEFWVFFGA